MKPRRILLKRWPEIRFAAPGEMFAKYAPDSDWNTKPKFKIWRNAALKKTTPLRISQHEPYSNADLEALKKLDIKHAREREDLKAKSTGETIDEIKGRHGREIRNADLSNMPMQDRINMVRRHKAELRRGVPDKEWEALAQRHHAEREAISKETGHTWTVPTADKKALMKADVRTNLDKTHTEYHRKRDELLAAHEGQRQRHVDAPDEVIESLHQSQKDELGALEGSYLKEVSHRPGYGTKQEITRAVARSSMADTLKERRGALQAIRKHIKSLPAPLPESELNKAGTGRIQREGRALPLVVGERHDEVKKGIASNHGKNAPFKLAGKSEPNLPAQLHEAAVDITKATHEEAGRLAMRHNKLYNRLLNRTSSRLQARYPEMKGKQLGEKASDIVHPLFTPEPPSVKARAKLSSSLGYRPEKIDKIYAVQRHIGVWKDTDQGLKTIRKRVENAGRFFNPPAEAAAETYPHLKKLGLGLGVAGALTAGGLIAKRLSDRKKRQFSARLHEIRFGRLDPITKFRFDKLGRLQGLGGPKGPAKLGDVNWKSKYEELIEKTKLMSGELAGRPSPGLDAFPDSARLMDRYGKVTNVPKPLRPQASKSKKAGHIAAQKIAQARAQIPVREAAARSSGYNRGLITGGSVATGAAGIAGGTLLIKNRNRKEQRFSVKDKYDRLKQKPAEGVPPLHDIATGALEGGLAFPASEYVLHKLAGKNPGMGRKMLAGGAVGGVATGLVGLGVSRILRARRNLKKQQGSVPGDSAGSSSILSAIPHGTIQFKIGRRAIHGGDHVYHDGKRLDIKQLIRNVSDRPATEVKISSLHGKTKSKRSGFTKRRLKYTNVNTPILRTHQNEVVDGRHRVIKKKESGQTHIRAIKVYKKDLDAVKMKSRFKLIRFGLLKRAAILGGSGAAVGGAATLLRNPGRPIKDDEDVSGKLIWRRSSIPLIRHYGAGLPDRRVAHIQSNKAGFAVFKNVSVDTFTGKRQVFVQRNGNNNGTDKYVNSNNHAPGKFSFLKHNCEDGAVRALNLRPTKTQAQDAEAGAAIGAGAGVAGAAIAPKIIRKIKSIHFDDGSSTLYPPYPSKKKRLTVAQDRYKKKIHGSELDRMEGNIASSAVAGAGLGAILHKTTGLKLGRSTGIGAGLGAAGAVGTIIATRKHRDPFGERTWGAKRTERLPWQLPGVAIGAIGARKIYKTLHTFAAGGDPTPWYDQRKYKGAKSLLRRGQELRVIGRRGYGVTKDIGTQARGEAFVDERGRPRTPEWQKPWATRGLAIGTIGAIVGGAALVSRNSQTIKAIHKQVGNLIRRVPGVKPTEDFYHGVKGETKTLIKKMDAKGRLKVEGLDLEKKKKEVAAAAEASDKKLKEVLKKGTTLSSKTKAIRFAEVVQDWDIRDARGKSARIYAPGSQTRYRRPKKWHEKKDNQKLLWEGALVATGGSGVAGTGLYQHFKNRPKPTPSEPIIGIRAEANKVIDFPAPKYSWLNKYKGPHRLSQKLDQLINFRAN